MKASKFSEAQIAFVLKQAEDGTAIIQSGSTAFTRSWGCSCATRCPAAG